MLSSTIPKVVTLEDFSFPFIERDVAGYKTLLLPQELRRLFDAEGAVMVRVNSLTLARAIPDFGGKGSGRYSLLPHQDHHNPFTDARRFLTLSKKTHGARGSTTILMYPSVASTLLPQEEAWIKDDVSRMMLGQEREYDRRFRISEKQYDRCFDEPHGYESVIGELLEKDASAARRVSVRLAVLNYLFRGPSADRFMETLLQSCAGMVVEERWERPGVVFIDNARVFHARMGGNEPPLQRNFCV